MAPGIELNSPYSRVYSSDYFFMRDWKMAKLSKILFHSLFISSALAQDESSESQTFKVTDCNDETNDVSKHVENTWST